MDKPITYCNHCGKPIEDIKELAFFRVKKNGNWVAAELCTECHKELTYIVEQFCSGKDEGK